MDNLINKKIAVLGYGVEGKSLTSYLIRHGVQDLYIYDEKVTELNSEHLAKAILIKTDIQNVDFDIYDVVFRSPGISREKINCDKGKVTSATDLFLETAKGRIVGVTGTKGKSTTVLLIKEILSMNSATVFVGGNIGTPMLDFVDDLNDNSYSILELSSFQLQDLKNSADVAVLLPIFPDHLDYHSSEQEYVESKTKIFSLSKDVDIISAKSNQAVIDFDKFSNKLLFFSEEDLSQEESKVALDSKIPQINLAAAIKFAEYEGIRVNIEEIKQFKKLPYRIEEIGDIHGVKFFNDSASTNPISTARAVNLLKGNTALIIGGASKGLNMDELCLQLAQSDDVKFIYIFGQEAEKFKTCLNNHGFNKALNCYHDLKQVFANLSLDGLNNVLFSPAYASFDQYDNYKDRGNDFNKLFEELKCKST